MNCTFNGVFHRSLIFTNIPLNGGYRYKDVFQILQSEVDLPFHRSGVQNLKPIIFEYDSSNYCYYKRLRYKQLDFEESFRHLDFSKELLAHITLVFNANFFTEKSYMCTKEMLGEDYFIGEFTKGNSINGLTTDDEYILKDINFLGDEIVKPTFIDKYFDKYFNLDENAMNRYRMSLTLYHNAIDIRLISPSMSYVALISAIENLFEFEGELNGFKVKKCKTCNGDIYKSTRRFKDFMKKYYPVDSPKYNKFLNTIYTRRSKITHAGLLHYNDYADTEIDSDGSKEVSSLKTMVRVALINWILLKQ